MRPFACDLLNASETDGAKRYAVHEGKAYCAQEDGRGAWHGYPVGWVDVPERHPLRGEYQGYWSVAVSGNWRIVFRFEAGEAMDVDLVDYH